MLGSKEINKHCGLSAPPDVVSLDELTDGLDTRLAKLIMNKVRNVVDPAIVWGV